MIQNKQYRLPMAEFVESQSPLQQIERMLGPRALRWYVAQVTDNDIVIEATIDSEKVNRGANSTVCGYRTGKTAVLNVIPTGVGCSIGGYAGDAAPITNLLASTADYLITNPNTLNASDFIGLNSDNLIYADGYSIDQFCRGSAEFFLPYSNKIGLIVEKADDWKLDAVFNIVNTARAVHGIEIVDCVITDKRIGGRCVKNKSGAFVGTIDNLEIVLKASEELIRKGATAIAVTSNIEDLPLDDYVQHFAGNYPNPVGGVEAIISYSIADRFQLPAAHAPMINMRQLDLENNIVDARGAGEFSSVSGLACILVGLRRAPQLAPSPEHRIADAINVNNLLAVVAPASCLGGIPMIMAQERKIPLIAVQQNQTILNVRQALGSDNIIEANSYAEAAGLVLALRKGLSLESISRPLATLRY